MNFSIFRRAFTLVELMVAMAVTVLLIGLLASIANSTSAAWKHGADRTETYSGARSALALIGRELQGAVIDLDLGYSIESRTGNARGYDYVLRFLTRRAPTESQPAGIQKIAYQVAWASRDLVPTLSESYSAGHPIPVLVRTAEFDDRNMDDVFDVTGGSNPWDWVRNWPSSSDLQDPDKTEVVAENVLGWEVNPIYFDPDSREIVVDGPDSSASISFVDNGLSNPPIYITSDLKYVKMVSGMANVKNASSPRAIEIRLAAVPSSIHPRLLQEAGLASIRRERNLMTPEDLPDTSLGRLLKQNMRVFDATYPLSSKTP